MANDDVQRKLAEQWRMRCPEGHADLRDKQGQTVYCRACASSYPYERLLDARTDQLPLGRR